MNLPYGVLSLASLPVVGFATLTRPLAGRGPTQLALFALNRPQITRRIKIAAFLLNDQTATLL